jgi:hypothetical protein
MISRREFSQHCAALLAALLPRRRARPGGGTSGPHPTPRPKITGAKVLTADELKDTPHLIPLFDSVRERPEIMDGIRCNCGCAGQPGFYSLLSCYEGDAMARLCPICQGEGRLAARLHKEGKTLAEIRVAVDAQFGG